MADIELAGARPPVEDNQGLPASAPENAADGPARPGGADVGRRLAAWVESRTSLGAVTRAVFDAPVPVLSRWRYALGAALVGALAVEFVTGLLMMGSYAPSVASAWGGAFYIDRVLAGGWFLRGLHSFAGNAMVVGAGLHLVSVVVAGVYRAPREMNWWLGLGMLGLTVAFILTGNALVWDQDGYWAWHVESGILGGTPVVGPLLKRLVIGGTELGNEAIGHLYALHAGLLPSLMVVTLGVHIVLSRRHTRTRLAGREGAVEPGWPKQIFLNTLITTIFLGVVSALVVLNRGVALDAPADPVGNYPARPAWFFFWLFELRKGFLGPREYIATLVIPGTIAAIMVLLPFFDRVLPRRPAHFLAVAFTFSVLGGAAYLTALSIHADASDEQYQAALREAHEARARAVRLASDPAVGVPPDGASYLLLRDPLYHGRAVLTAKCLGCHVDGGVGNGTQSAPDLKDFGSRAWLRGLLDDPKSARYFGKARGCGAMARWKKRSKLTPKELDDVADFFARFVIPTPDDMTPTEWLEQDGLEDHPGYVAFNKDGECATCHADWTAPNEEAPNLFAWGSPRWMARLILKPGAGDKYGYLDPEHQMPSFAGQLTDNDLRTIIRYLKNDYPDAPGAPPAHPAAAASR